jgi:uncharacterized protein YndB with AHSA1/START domain
MASRNKPNELYLTRLYDAPLKTVWEAWVDPAQVAKWWGPRGFTITTHHKDVRTGGSWSYIMHGPDGVDYPNETKFLEVEKYSKMVYDHGGFKDKPPMFRVTVIFTEIAGKTQMDFTMVFPTPEIAAQSKIFIKNANGNSTWDRLAEYLSPTDKFVINRSFDASIDLMFTMWTDPKHFSQWLPPTGFTMKFLKADIKVGGTGFFCMSGANDIKMYGKTKYIEITKPNRIVYTQIFCDENENVSRHPMAPTWPETMLTTINLYEEDSGKTRVTVTWEPNGKTTKEEVDTFLNARSGMTQGWNGSFDKLDEYLAKQYKC